MENTIQIKKSNKLQTTEDVTHFLLAHPKQKARVLKTIKGELHLRDSGLQKIETQFEEHQKSGAAKAFFQEIFLSDGASIHILWLPENLGAYEVQTLMRQKLSPVLKKMSIGHLQLDLSGVRSSWHGDLIEYFIGLLELIQWQPPKISKKPETPLWKFRQVSLDIKSQLSPAKVKEHAHRAQLMGRAINLCRTLTDTPANHLTPKIYRQLLEKRSKANKYSFHFYDRKELTKLGAGAFLAVAQGHLEDASGIAHLWKKAKKASAKKVVLVGKGLCFDTGGYNIKVKYMHGMQKDMGGSAVALAAFELLAKLYPEIEFHAYLGITENLISHQAYKPNDVITALDGTTIEVTDTDAEGRMVLADTLALARKEKPDLLLDYATLTGAAVNSIGTRRAAIFAQPESLQNMALQVGQAAGERVWAFPMGEDYMENLKSEVADIVQCQLEPGVDHINAATFLGHFVGKEIPWLHMDLSTVENKGGLGLSETFTTGYGIRFTEALVRKYLRMK